jgi:hypothetical protein
MKQEEKPCDTEIGELRLFTFFLISICQLKLMVYIIEKV